MSRVDQERSRSRSGSARSLQLGRASKEISLLEEAAFFQNPVLSLCIVMYCTVHYCTVLQVLSHNSPDPGVTRLQDGSGWALVTTTNNASRAANSPIFPIYFSGGRDCKIMCI